MKVFSLFAAAVLGADYSTLRNHNIPNAGLKHHKYFYFSLDESNVFPYNIFSILYFREKY